MDAAQGRWWLAAQYSSSSVQAAMTLARIRDLTSTEVERARGANKTLARLAAVDPYSRLKTLYELVESLRRAQSADRLSELNQAARALGKNAIDLPSAVRTLAAVDFADDAERLAMIEDAVGEETARSPFRLLVAVGTLKHGPFAFAGGRVANDLDAIKAMSAHVPEVHGGLDLVAGLGKGVVVAQRIIGRQLLAYADLIEREGRFLMHLAADVPYGNAVLVESVVAQADGEQDSPEETNIRSEVLALDEALRLFEALARTRPLLETTHRTRLPHPPAGVSVDHQVPPAEPADPVGQRDEQVVDLRALAAHATELADELERAWSNALDAVLLAKAHQELTARHQSLVSTIQRRAAAGERALRAAGVDTGLPAMVLPPQEVLNIALTPEGRQAWLQRQLAEFDALSGLLQAITLLRTPSARRVFGDGRQSESWWQAGAFLLVRERAAALARTCESITDTEEALSGRLPDKEPLRAVLDSLTLAAAAHGRGDALAALMHTRLAIFQRAGESRAVVPEDLLERIARTTVPAHEAHVLRLLDEAVRSTTSGAAPDSGAAVLLAPRALAIVTRLCLDTPQTLAAALEGEDPDVESRP